jgi:3-keto-5-aminohexanoate cleavage enzyme
VNDPLIISVAVTGGEHTRDATSYLPVTPDEIAASAVEAHRAGAAIAHIHVWDEAGRPSQDPELFRRVYELVEAECDLVLNLTTGPGDDPPEDVRLRSLELRPELASFDAGSMNFGDFVFRNRPAFLRRMAETMRETETKPELEVFDEGMIHNCLRLHAEGLLDAPLYFQFVLGVPGGAAATPETLLHLVRTIPPGSPWSATGIGRHAVAVAMLAIVLGGHVRVGLEDSIYYRRGELATSNAQLVARVARIAEEAGRPLATPDEARALLGLKGRARVGDRAGVS